MAGFIEDTRALLQDLVTPDLKALQAQMSAMDTKMSALEKATGAQISASEKAIDARLRALEAAIVANKDIVLAQIKSLEGKVDANHASVLHSLDIDRRLERVERMQQQSESFTPFRSGQRPKDPEAGSETASSGDVL